jgi:hypothetical protein
MSATVFDRDDPPGRREPLDTPLAAARLSDRRPIPSEKLDQLLRAFAGASIGQSYFGPSGFCEDGTPWIVMLANEAGRPKFYRERAVFAMMAWRWNVAPSALVSLTVLTTRVPPPHQRWMAPETDPVVQAIRTRGEFLVCIAHPGGGRSGWFAAQLVDPAKKHPPPYLNLFEGMWKESSGGLQYSRVGVRFDPMSRTHLHGDDSDEIPLWGEPISDAWYTLSGTGPWSSDLQPKDLRIGAWGRVAYWARQRMAGFVQAVKERQEFDGIAPVASEDGFWMVEGIGQEPANAALKGLPKIRAVLAAVGGPTPDPKEAYARALDLLRDPREMFHLFSNIMRWLAPTADETVGEALQGVMKAVLLDSSVTATGTRRPWLKNVPEGNLELHSFELDLTGPLDGIETLWRIVTDVTELLDGGLWFGARDYPAPLDVVNAAMECVRVEGAIEEAEERALALLREAQDARQWSIPWGARVQIDFGPFVALKIHEMDGEFACLFLDENDRYLHVAIGLGDTSPKINCPPFLRKQDDSDEFMSNEDAQVSLELIAAAIVRDFLVVEDRESIFTSRPLRRRIAGRNVSTLIYLPRVRYSAPFAATHAQEEVQTAPQVRARHPVAHHLRKAGSASAAQRFLAQRYGIHVPQGFTFVRPHERGNEAHPERVRTYRSRSASRMLFQEIAVAPVGSRPAWFDFERDCARLLTSRGMRVIHQAAQRDGDGGVDLFAVDADENPWVVQCKCWSPARPVGPDVVRELVGAIASADRGSDRQSRGMILTTSRFTSGAASEAIKLGFTIVDGAALAAQLRSMELRP